MNFRSFVQYAVSRGLAILSVMVIMVMAVATAGTYWIHQWVSTPLAVPVDQIILIKPGDTLSQLAYRLERENIIRFPQLFIGYARVTQKTDIKTGEYLLTKGSNYEDLLRLLDKGDVLTYSITLVEGRTFDEFLDTLHNTPKLSHTLDKNSHVSAILQQLNLDLLHPEGWFFPDTYHFVNGTTDVELLQQAYRRMQSILDVEWENRTSGLPYNSPYEALIMASIIEKETGVAHERSEIAGVFVRRLQQGMRLQTDPTVIYGMGKHYQGNLRRKHLMQRTDYNTYVINGLPPTPISMPGREAIHAALHPKEGKSLFFVAKGDGSHHFSSTLKEHVQAVKQYQLSHRGSDYRSSPKK